MSTATTDPPEPDSGSFGAVRVATAAVATVLVASIAALVATLIAMAGRGLDLTDEGMYLYSADPRAEGVAFHNAFGRVTGLLYAVVGHDVVRFRIVGILILVGAAAVLGDRVAVAGARTAGRRIGWAPRLVAVSLVVAGALHYYSLMLVTPSYNWLNLVGLLVAVSAGVELLGRAPLDEPTWGWGWASAFAAAVFAATMGKLSSGPLLVVGLAVLLVWSGRGSVGGRLSPLLRSVPGAVSVAVLFGIAVDPPWVTVDEVQRGSRLLAALDPASYSLLAAVEQMVSAARTIGRGAVLGVLPGVAVVALGALWIRRGPDRDRFRAAVHGLAFVVAGLGAAASGAWNGGQAGYGTVGWAWVALASTGFSVAMDRVGAGSVGADTVGDGEPSRWRSRRSRAGAVAVMCLLGGAAFAFGSGNGFFAQTGGAVALFVAPLALLAVDTARSAPDGTARSGGLIGVLAATFVLVVGAWSISVAAMVRPYRQPSLAEATVPVTIGERGGSVLLTPQRARFVGDVRAAAAAAGWRPRTPMLDFSHYSAALLYLLDAEPPPTILVSVGGYVTVDDVARLSLDEARRVDRRKWADAWLLTSTVDEAGFAPDPRLVERLGRSFPSEYRLVGSFDGPTGGLQMWKPR